MGLNGMISDIHWEDDPLTSDAVPHPKVWRIFRCRNPLKIQVRSDHPQHVTSFVSTWDHVGLPGDFPKFWEQSIMANLRLHKQNISLTSWLGNIRENPDLQ